MESAENKMTNKLEKGYLGNPFFILILYRQMHRIFNK